MAFKIDHNATLNPAAPPLQRNDNSKQDQDNGKHVGSKFGIWWFELGHSAPNEAVEKLFSYPHGAVNRMEYQ